MQDCFGSGSQPSCTDPQLACMEKRKTALCGHLEWSCCNHMYKSTWAIQCKMQIFIKVSILDKLLKREVSRYTHPLLLLLLVSYWQTSGSTGIVPKPVPIFMNVSWFHCLTKWACLVLNIPIGEAPFLKMLWCGFCWQSRAEGFHSFISTCNIVLAGLTYPSLQKRLRWWPSPKPHWATVSHTITKPVRIFATAETPERWGLLFRVLPF